jgi:hypothetical protein
LRAIEPVLAVEGVLVIGSEIPNLLERGAASTLVVSQDVDIGVPVGSHAEVKQKLPQVRGLRPSREEPSVWVPEHPGLIEVNFVGMDPGIRGAGETYVLDDSELPLLVFGTLSLLRAGTPIEADGLRIPVPRPAGLLLEKLVTDRSGEKGDRDLLVVLGLLLVVGEDDLSELAELYKTLSPEQRYAVRSGITILSLLEPIAGMPDPRPHRGRLVALLRTLEGEEPSE